MRPRCPTPAPRSEFASSFRPALDGIPRAITRRARLSIKRVVQIDPESAVQFENRQVRELFRFALRRAGGRRCGHRRQRHPNINRNVNAPNAAAKTHTKYFDVISISKTANSRCAMENHPFAFFAAFASHRSNIAIALSGKFSPQFTPIPNPGHIYTTRRRRLKNFVAASQQNFHVRARWQRLQRVHITSAAAHIRRPRVQYVRRRQFRDDCDQRQRVPRRIPPVGHDIAHGRAPVSYRSALSKWNALRIASAMSAARGEMTLQLIVRLPCRRKQAENAASLANASTIASKLDPAGQQVHSIFACRLRRSRSSDPTPSQLRPADPLRESRRRLASKTTASRCARKPAASQPARISPARPACCCSPARSGSCSRSAHPPLNLHRASRPLPPRARPSSAPPDSPANPAAAYTSVDTVRPPPQSSSAIRSPLSPSSPICAESHSTASEGKSSSTSPTEINFHSPCSRTSPIFTCSTLSPVVSVASRISTGSSARLSSTSAPPICISAVPTGVSQRTSGRPAAPVTSDGLPGSFNSTNRFINATRAPAVSVANVSALRVVKYFVNSVSS